MTEQALMVTGTGGALETVKQTFLAGRNPGTARVYGTRLTDFIDWYAGQPSGQPPLALLRGYVAELQRRGLSPRTIQAGLNTVKGFLRTAAALDPSLSASLPQLDLVKAPAVRGEIQGKRLTEAERQALLDAPGITTHKGRRDTAILALLAVCGLRRAEVCSLSWGHITELDGHKVIQNLKGKHGRVRTVKLPPALWRRIIEWGERAGLDQSTGAPVFVAVRKGDAVQPGQRLTPGAIAYLVEAYSRAIRPVHPHDLRRTAASLSRKGGASIEQVQALLGHASPQTTSAYIGESLDLDNNAVDYGKVVIR